MYCCIAGCVHSPLYILPSIGMMSSGCLTIWTSGGGPIQSHLMSHTFVSSVCSVVIPALCVFSSGPQVCVQ